MKDTRSIEEQVAELTEEQRKNIICVYRWEQWFMPLVCGISILLFLLFFGSSSLYSVDPEVVLGIFGFIVIGVMLIVFVIFKVIVLIKVPYYDRHKARYIIKLHSQRR